MTRASNISGALIEASAPIMALTECPTNTASLRPKLPADLHDVVGIALEQRVFLGVVSSQVRTPRADMVEQDRAEVRLERRGHEAPHILVAAKPMREHHRFGATAGLLDIVS